ncbi:DUF1993 domain-containing protein [Acidovorax sp. SUPP3434]|nr:DUF1993 domain-containing protein [Acidovorax sp. SUPP3434]
MQQQPIAGVLAIRRRSAGPLFKDRPAMTSFMYSASVPVFKQMLGSLGDVVSKTEAHATARKIDPDALLQARLFPDMFPLARQVLVACDFAKGIAARLAGVEVPSLPDAERPGFADLRTRIDTVLAFIEGLPTEAFDEAAARQIILQPGTPREKQFAGQHYLLHYGLPQFFFHVNATYAIARHNGVELGKRDYMGKY